MGIKWVEAGELMSMATSTLAGTEIVLDIGCGIMPQRYIRPSVHICCEPFSQYIEHLEKKIINEQDRHWVLINASWEDAVRLFPPKSVDTVFLIDIVEHLVKDEALKLMGPTVEIARRQVVVFTPIGFLPQKHPDMKDAWGLDGGAWQEHKSGWQPEDFDDTWDIYATKAFHHADNMGRHFEKPYGALWAIKNHI